MNQLTEGQLNMQHIGKYQLAACDRKASIIRITTNDKNVPNAYGRRNHAVIAIDKKGKEIVTSYKNCEKQGFTFLKFADKQEISLK